MGTKKCNSLEESQTDDTYPLDSCILKDVYEGKIKLTKSSVQVEHIGPLGDIRIMIRQNNTYFNENIIFSNTIRSIINVINTDSLPSTDLKSNSYEMDKRGSVTFAPLPGILIIYNRMSLGEYEEHFYVCKYTNKID
uniref:Uncharacterized protein n=1 Tax=Strongyloides papillosus TaxID=174720 RepID=A0A0N5BR08_STREA